MIFTEASPQKFARLTERRIRATMKLNMTSYLLVMPALAAGKAAGGAGFNLNRHEARYKNTSRKMQDAAEKLLTEKDYADVTVQDICREAPASRTTFYSHYDSVPDLFYDLLRRKVGELFQSEDASVRIDLPELIEKGQMKTLSSEKILMPFLAFVEKNQTLFRAMERTDPVRSRKEESRLEEYLFRPVCLHMHITDPDDIDYFFTFFMSGFFSVIYRWVRGNCRRPKEDVCRIIRRCLGDT